MEICNHLTDIDSLGAWNIKPSRLYFGDEFCDRLIPDRRGVKNILGFVKKNKYDFTLVAPISTDKGLEKLKDIFPDLPQGTEVIFNDWGVLEMINEFGHLNPVLGRVLSREIVSTFLSSEYPKEDRYDIFSDFIRSGNVNRMELDGFLSDNTLTLLDKLPFHFSFVYPTMYISITGRCGLNHLSNPYKESFGPCENKCKEYMFVVKNQLVKELFLLNGKSFSIFSRNILRHKKIDRLVYQHEVLNVLRK
jgi:hypothetical protein